MLYCILIYAIFAFLLLFRVKAHPFCAEPAFFSGFNRLRGLFALEIVVGHVVRYENSLLYPLGKFMIISVAFFFFVSAYGMSRSFHQKPNYLAHFLFPKCACLIALAAIAYVHSLLCQLLSGRTVVFSRIPAGFFASTNWYIWELLFFYALFYGVYRYLPKYRIAVIAAVTAVGAVICYFVGLPQGYYSSSLAFPAGLLFYEHFDAVTGFLKTVAGKIAAFLLTCAGLSSLAFGTDSVIGMVVLRNLMCLSGLILLTYFLAYLTADNPCLRILGKYSTEIYLYQFVFLQLTGGLLPWPVRIPAVFALTFASALLLFPLNRLVRRALTGTGGAHRTPSSDAGIHAKGAPHD